MKSTVYKKKAAPEKQVPAQLIYSKHHTFPIVAIGASAGGLEAITQLLQNLPADTGMAFIYVQHLSPDHESLLASLLSKTTNMKVQEVTNGILMKPDNLYVIPPDKEINVIEGHIKMTGRPKTPKVNLPIDTLFTSLAQTHKAGAIGIILSGSASDGTRGISAIKAAGGFTFAQDDSAKFTSMPHSAIAEGVVDFVLSPKEIALELAHLSKQPFVRVNSVKTGEDDLKEPVVLHNDPDLKIILNLIYKATNVDFNVYKISIIKRRIIRRMLIYKIKNLKQYTKLLKDKSSEIDLLFQDLLINVTGFFRDADTNQYLKTTILPKLLKSKNQNEPLRLWITACSTGEEAYSIAMMILEIQATKSSNVPVQIFATDLSTKAIVKARMGVYFRNELDTVSPGRLQRFFTKADDGYRISKTVRDMCVFAPHNILCDPPFSRLDFISCGNLFIYFDAAAQKKTGATFHYALNDNGYLMLGKSETIGSDANYFNAVNSKFKIYQRKKISGIRLLPALSPRLAHNGVNDNGNNNRTIVPQKPALVLSLDKAIDAVLVSDFLPPSVVINHEMEILQFRGSTALYLTHAPGKATFNILKMTRPELAFELRNAISQAIKTKQCIRKSGIEIKVNDILRVLCFEVVPLKIEWSEPLLLILFTELQQVETDIVQSNGSKTSKDLTATAKDRRIKKLEAELRTARADMLAFTHEQEAFNEELQSANEEVVSANEELQTVNEELETSKEETESSNEELITTNHELLARNDLLNESYEYSEAIIATMHEPMIILKKDLRVKSANKSFYKTFKLNEEQTEGQLFYDIGNKLWNDIPRLRELLNDIIPKKTHFHDFEVTHNFPGIGERTLLLNANLLVQQTIGEKLILLAINDITELRMQALARHNAEKKYLGRFKDLLMQAPVAIMLLKGSDYTVEMANDTYLQIIEKGKNFIGKPIFESLPELTTQGVKQILDNVMLNGIPFYGNEVEVRMLRNEKGEQGFYNFVYQPIIERDATVTGIIVVVNEVTEQVVARKKMEAQAAMVHNLLMTAPGFVCTLTGPNHVYGLVNEQYQKLFGKRQIQGKPILEALPELIGQGFDKLLDNVYNTGSTYVGIDIPIKMARDENLKPEIGYYNFSYQPMFDENKKVFSILVFGYEVTEQVFAQKKNEDNMQVRERELEEKVQQRTGELRNAIVDLEKTNKRLEAFAYVSSHDLQEPLRKIQTFAGRIIETEIENLSERGRDYFLRMQKSANRMQALINDILVFSRINAAERKFENTDLNKIIKEVKIELKQAITKKHATIEVGKLCKANVIVFQFKQMMLNLVSNALKFSKPGTSPHIEITSSILKGSEIKSDNLSPHQNYCHIKVKDNGIGFEMEYSERIFEVFQRLHSKDEFEGTGIGLAIVKEIIANHNGFITAISELNKGTTFDIYLPQD